MYIPEGNKEFKEKPKKIKIYPYLGEYFAARAVAKEAKEKEETKPRRAWFSIPLRTIGKGLEYLYSLNPLEAVERLGGFAKGIGKGIVGFGKDIAAAPSANIQIKEYEKEVKRINDQITALKAKKEAGKISKEAYRKSLKITQANLEKIKSGISGVQKELEPFTPQKVLGDAASAVAAITAVSPAVSLAKGIPKAGKAVFTGGIKKAFTPTIPKAVGKVGRGLQFITAARPISTPVGKAISAAAKKLAGGAVATDIARRAIPEGKERFKPIKLTKEGAKREAIKFGGSMITPLPFVGAAFQKITKAKKYIGNAADYQAAESAFKKFFGEKAINKVSVFKDKEIRAAAEAYFLGVMKEKGMTINKKNIVSFLDSVYNPKVDDLPMISQTVKRILKANGITKIEDAAKMSDDTLAGIIKDKGSVKKLKEAIEEVGKTDFTGMHFKTPEEQLKALASFMYKGVHSGTWRGTPQELKAEILKKYDEIVKGIKGPEISKKFIQAGKQKAITPPKEYKFKMTEPIGAWTKKTVKEQGFDTLYNQGVRELPKGDASFLEGRKALLGKAINKLKEGVIGRFFVPQNSKAIYQKIRNKLDKSLYDVFGRDAERAREVIKKKLQKPMISIGGKDVPIYRPTERELGKSVWKEIVAEILSKSKYSSEVAMKAEKLDKSARQAFVTSWEEAGIPTHLINKLRSYSSWYNAAYFYYTLGRFHLRTLFWFQQVPEVKIWGEIRADKLPAGSLIRKAVQNQIKLKRTIGDFLHPELTKGQRAVLSGALGYTEDILLSGWRQLPFMVKNEANAYGLGLLLKTDEALKNMPVVKAYLKKHGLKSVEEIPYLKKVFYKPLADDPEAIAQIIKKYGFSGAKAHLADETKTVLSQGKESAIFDNAIREALKLGRYTAFEEAVPLFLYNPNRSAFEKSLHSGIMFPLSYLIKVIKRGGEYLIGGKALRPKVAAVIINKTQDWHESEKGKAFERKYWNLINAGESWLPLDPSYPFSLGYLPPFSKMIYRWMESPDYYLDKEKGPERSLKVLIPSYREMKGWQYLLTNIKDLQDDIRGDILEGKMTEKQAKEILENFRYKEPKEITPLEIPKLPLKPVKKKEIKTRIPAKERIFQEKKERRGKLLETPEAKIKKKEKTKYEGIIKAVKKKKAVLPKAPTPTREKYYNP